MRILKARYRNGSEFLNQFQGSFLNGGVFFPTRQQVPVGENVVVEIRFPELDDRLLVRGFVAWRRQGKYRSGLRAGLGIEFLAAERHKRDYIVSVARGEIANVTSVRKHKRLPVELRVDWRVKEERGRHTAILEDIGPGGAFLRTAEQYPKGTAIVIELTPPGAAAPLAIEGRVAWIRRTPSAEGLGVEFRCRDAGGARRIKELIRRLESSESSAA